MSHQVCMEVENVVVAANRPCVVGRLISAEPKIGATLVGPDGSRWRVVGAAMPTVAAYREGKRGYVLQGLNGTSLPPIGSYQMIATERS